MPDAQKPTPFTIAVPDAELDDLRRRLESARFPAELPGSGWDYGTEQAFLRSVIERWRDGYDWRRTEAEFNGWGSFVTTAAGQRVHLLHARSDDDHAIPLVLVHGWPGSIVEFLDVMPLLCEKFHLVVVSMPGYGFSGPTTERGVDTAKVAAAVVDVMGQLGYDRFLAQGGDWGAIVVRHLGEHYPQHAVAIHTNMLFAPFEGEGSDAMVGVTERELAAIVASVQRITDGTAYMDIQSTRPHSLGFGLDDSPLGLAGWILEKFHAWCDVRDGMPISTDRLIDNLMLYWLTGTATSAARLYCETARAGTAARGRPADLSRAAADVGWHRGCAESALVHLPHGAAFRRRASHRRAARLRYRPGHAVEPREAHRLRDRQRFR